MTALLWAIQALFVLCLLALTLPVCVLALQVAAARRAEPALGPREGATRPSVGVLVPAHNEAAGIGATLTSVRSQLQAGDRLLVVADNCTDDTALLARDAGAQVVQRTDADLRGKGYALAFGVRQFEPAPPEVVIMIDADCLLQPHALDRLARICWDIQRPVQAAYLMHARSGAGPEKKVAQFAWAVKNLLRPLGWKRFGLGCQLTGSGMALPWAMASAAPLASGHITEDMKLGLDFALAGMAPAFCPEAVVTSTFADNAEGGTIQRTRWEHGHLALIAQYGPRLLWRALRRRDLGLFALAVDLCVPPVSLLLMLATGMSAWGALAWSLAGDPLPWALAIPLAPLLACALVLAWIKVGRAILPLRQIAHVFVYALAKVPLYLSFLVRRQLTWIASTRDKP